MRMSAPYHTHVTHMNVSCYIQQRAVSPVCIRALRTLSHRTSNLKICVHYIHIYNLHICVRTIYTYVIHMLPTCMYKCAQIIVLSQINLKSMYALYFACMACTYACTIFTYVIHMSNCMCGALKDLICVHYIHTCDLRIARTSITYVIHMSTVCMTRLEI